MIVDAHVHLMPKSVREDRRPFCDCDEGFCVIYQSDKARMVDPEQIVAYMDESGIDKAVVFGFPWCSMDNIRRNNDEVWDFHAKHPNRIIPFAVLSPTEADANPIETERTLCGGFRGIGELALYGGEDKLITDFADLDPVIDIAAKHGAPVLLHVNEPVGHHYPGKLPVDFNGLLHLIDRHNDVSFILAHWGGGLFFYALMPEVKRILKRTYFDTAASPFLYSPEIYRIAAQIIGPDRIIFGSDYPLLGLKRYRKELGELRMGEEFERGVFGETFKSEINNLGIIEHQPKL